jgi:hypothetical protein
MGKLNVNVDRWIAVVIVRAQDLDGGCYCDSPILTH